MTMLELDPNELTTAYVLHTVNGSLHPYIGPVPATYLDPTMESLESGAWSALTCGRLNRDKGRVVAENIWEYQKYL